jgi:hypothetical protein
VKLTARLPGPFARHPNVVIFCATVPRPKHDVCAASDRAPAPAAAPAPAPAPASRPAGPKSMFDDDRSRPQPNNRTGLARIVGQAQAADTILSQHTRPSEPRGGAQDRASPNFMGLASLGLDIGILCGFLYSVLLLDAILDLNFLRLALSRPQPRGSARPCENSPWLENAAAASSH